MNEAESCAQKLKDLSYPSTGGEPDWEVSAPAGKFIGITVPNASAVGAYFAVKDADYSMYDTYFTIDGKYERVGLFFHIGKSCWSDDGGCLIKTLNGIIEVGSFPNDDAYAHRHCFHVDNIAGPGTILAMAFCDCRASWALADALAAEKKAIETVIAGVAKSMETWPAKFASKPKGKRRV